MNGVPTHDRAYPLSCRSGLTLDVGVMRLRLPAGDSDSGSR